MRAVVFTQHGGPEVLHEVHDAPEPALRADGVVVRVRACSVNHLDIWARRGLPYAIEMPHILGNDVAGVIEAVGAQVEHVKPGDEVVLSPGAGCGHCGYCLCGDDNFCLEYDLLGLRKQGGYAELVASPARNAFPKPAQLSFEEAASMPLVFLTAWHMLVGLAALKQGETVLVLAAGSGVGIAAVQIAKLLGASVIATASSDAKLEKAIALGADHVVNYERNDFAQETRKITGKRGVNVVVEHTGETTWEKSLASLGRGGRLVTCGATSGFAGKTDLRALFGKQLAVYGSYMGRLSESREVWSHIAAGRLKPVVDRALPLAEARAAHEAMERREQFGKIVLVP